MQKLFLALLSKATLAIGIVNMLMPTVNAIKCSILCCVIKLVGDLFSIILIQIKYVRQNIIMPVAR